MKTLFASICLLFSSFFSCQQKGGSFESLSVGDFADVISDPDVQRLDVRTVAEYSEGHIPGSVNVNVLPQFGIRIVHKKVGSLTNILYLYG